MSRISRESINDIREIAGKFSVGVENFRELLIDSDKNDLKSLSVRLDFNEFYSFTTLKQDLYYEDSFNQRY